MLVFRLAGQIKGQGPSRPRAKNLHLAEAEGFEPSIPFQVYRFSRATPSTTRPRLHQLRTLIRETNIMHFLCGACLCQNLPRRVAGPTTPSLRNGKSIAVLHHEIKKRTGGALVRILVTFSATLTRGSVCCCTADSAPLWPVGPSADHALPRPRTAGTFRDRGRH